MIVAMFIAVLGIVFSVGVVGFKLGGRQPPFSGLASLKPGSRHLPPFPAPPEDRRLAEQAERIELLEDELQRVKDQADFTERLLTERGGAHPGDALEGDAPD